MGFSGSVVWNSHFTKHYSAVIPTGDTTVQKYSLYYWQLSFKIRNCPITPISRHWTDFWFLNVRADVFKLIILTQLTLSSKCNLRLCCTSESLEFAEEKHQIAWYIIKITFQPPFYLSTPMPLPQGYLLVTINTGLVLFTVLSTPWYLKTSKQAMLKV